MKARLNPPGSAYPISLVDRERSGRDWLHDMTLVQARRLLYSLSKAVILAGLTRPKGGAK